MLISHNSFTSLCPVSVSGLMKLLIPFVRCQEKLLKDQKADILDIRLRKYRGEWYICHGRVRFCSLDYGLIYISRWGLFKEGVRVLLEHQSLSREEYIELGDYLESNYPKTRFYVGRDKKTWEKILDFPDIPDLIQYVGSMQSWIGKICPKLWWNLVGRKHQAEYLERSKTENICLDFI